MNWLTAADWLVLAQQKGGGGAGGAAPGGGLLGNPLLLMGMLVMLFWLIVMRPQGRERRVRAEMLAALKKNDRVLTAAGIFGVVTNVQRETGEVTIKVDETSGAKLRVAIDSIARVLGDEEKDDKEKDNKDKEKAS